MEDLFCGVLVRLPETADGRFGRVAAMLPVVDDRAHWANQLRRFCRRAESGDNFTCRELRVFLDLLSSWEHDLRRREHPGFVDDSADGDRIAEFFLSVWSGGADDCARVMSLVRRSLSAGQQLEARCVSSRRL